MWLFPSFVPGIQLSVLYWLLFWILSHCDGQMQDIMMARREQLAVQFSINALWEFIKYQEVVVSCWEGCGLSSLADVEIILIDEPTANTSYITSKVSII